MDKYELYVVARRVLLDALDALHDQIEAVVVVGAQAVYLRSQDAALASAVYTSDGDLGIDPRLLNNDPLLDEAMARAGFIASSQPGTWQRPENVGNVVTSIAIDLLVPEAVAGGTPKQRGARIPPHSKMAARKVPGLEPALMDNDVVEIRSLDAANDQRAIQVKVAGVGALLVAKAYKIADRLVDGKAERLSDKDAGDVLRLMSTSDPEEVADRCEYLLSLPDVAPVVRTGLELLHSQFGASHATGTEMAARALAGDLPESRIRVVAPAFVRLLASNLQYKG
ncbi:hypothetical protein [Micromonospora haikouensis]|uniref:hypothetical protein n=1 Tax=Micromonospora haikouensis TaxID=686309 RepID=UPI003D73B14E